MIGVVIVAHGGLAGEFRAALEHVVGPQERLEALPIGPDDDVEARRMELIEAVRRVDAGNGVIVLTDMFGGTPSNLAISVMAETGAEVLAGINLPMLIKLASVRGEATLRRGRECRQGGGPQVHQRRQPGPVRRGLSGGEPSVPVLNKDKPCAEVTIRNRKGLHARASAKFVKCAESFDATVRGHARRPDASAARRSWG